MNAVSPSRLQRLMHHLRAIGGIANLSAHRFQRETQAAAARILAPGEFDLSVFLIAIKEIPAEGRVPPLQPDQANHALHLGPRFFAT